MLTEQVHLYGPATYRYPAYKKETPTKPKLKWDALGQFQAHNDSTTYLRLSEREEEDEVLTELVKCSSFKATKSSVTAQNAYARNSTIRHISSSNKNHNNIKTQPTPSVGENFPWGPQHPGSRMIAPILWAVCCRLLRLVVSKFTTFMCLGGRGKHQAPPSYQKVFPFYYETSQT